MFVLEVAVLYTFFCDSFYIAFLDVYPPSINSHHQDDMNRFLDRESQPKSLFATGILLLAGGKIQYLSVFSFQTLPSWWFQPIWKILVKMDHFPK